jgi:integrase
MGGKRQFGSVRKLPSGRWQARYRGLDGRLVTAPRTFATKGDAGRWLASVEADRARGIWLDPTSGRVRLDEYAKAWLESRVNLAPRTREIYDLQLRLHIVPNMRPDVPALGSLYLCDITPDVVRSWYAALAATRTKSVAAKAYVRLRQILNQAVNDDRLVKNPCRIDAGGAERHPEQRFISLAELFDLAAAVPDRYRALVLTAGLGGLRQGELFGLRCRDLDLLHESVTVRRKRIRLASGDVLEDDPKTDAGRRKVALPQPLVEALDAHIASYCKPGRDAYVFTTDSGLPIDRDNFRNRIWQPATRRAGLEGVRFHDLRHAAGTLAARTGATTKELMARLGHASPRAAMVYQHATEDRDRLIAERLTEMTVQAGLAPVVPITDACSSPESDVS